MVFSNSSKIFVSNAEIRTTVRVMFVRTINCVYLKVFLSLPKSNSSTHPLYPPFDLLLLLLPLSVSQLSVMYVFSSSACVLTGLWTVLQAKVQRLFLRVRI